MDLKRFAAGERPSVPGRGFGGLTERPPAKPLIAAVEFGRLFHGMLPAGVWSTERESNFFDGAAPFYRTYRTADGQFMAVGALEPQFYRRLLTGLGLEAAEWPQHDRSRWPELAKRIAGAFGRRSHSRSSRTDRALRVTGRLSLVPGPA
jgi:alpha-methylacyl-CoA racemase